MKYCIYKIENLQNHKKYIGLTNNPSRRRSRHFTDLAGNRHDNLFLQKEYNKYGKDNFSFEVVFEDECTDAEIGLKEQEYIAFYDSYWNGYNQNTGGNFGASNGGSQLTKSDIFNICAALEFCSRPGGVLAKMFEVTTTTISRIKKKMSHQAIIEEYEALPLIERKTIFEIFNTSSNFIDMKVHQTILVNKRKLTKEQVLLILANEEYGRIIPCRAFCREYNVSSNTIYTILSGKSYQDVIYEYNNYTQEQKEQLVSLLRNQQKQTP